MLFQQMGVSFLGDPPPTPKKTKNNWLVSWFPFKTTKKGATLKRQDEGAHPSGSPQASFPTPATERTAACPVPGEDLHHFARGRLRLAESVTGGDR